MKTPWNAFWCCHVYNMYWSDISVKFHFTDFAPCSPSRATGPSTAASKLIIEVSDHHIMDAHDIKDPLRWLVMRSGEKWWTAWIQPKLPQTEIFLQNYSDKNFDICSGIITNIYNCKTVPSFPLNLKYADVNPIHKKDDSTDKRNLRPVSILPVVSKVFECTRHHTINKYPSNRLCGFRKGYSTQLSLMIKLEEIKRYLDKGNVSGMLLTDYPRYLTVSFMTYSQLNFHAYAFVKANFLVENRDPKLVFLSVIGPIFLVSLNDLFLGPFF